MIGFLAHYDYLIDLIGSIIGVLLYVATTHTLQQRRHPAAALSWMLMFLFLPLVAIPAYILFGQRKFKADPAQLLPPWPMRIRGSEANADSAVSSHANVVGGAPLLP